MTGPTLRAGVVCVLVAASWGHAAPVPVASAGKPTLDRVKLDDVTGLLRQESVRKEVGLSDDDYKALSDFRKGKHAEIQKQMQADIQAQIQAQVGGGRGGAITIRSSGEKTAKATAEMNAEYAKKAGEALKPDGAKRLRQAVLQSRGPRALLDRLVIRELQLTAEQEDKIDALMPFQGADMVTADRVEKLAEERDAALAAALKMLTPEQRKKWDTLVGKPLPTADLLKASPQSEESMMEAMEAMRFGIGGFAIPAAPALPPPPPLPVEEKKEK